MTKTTKTVITGAAIAGLLAGTAAVHASSPANAAKVSLSALSQDKQDDGTKKLEKHACKGQNSCKGGCKSGDNGCKGKNSCKGKGGCRTDGKKPADEKTPQS